MKPIQIAGLCAVAASAAWLLPAFHSPASPAIAMTTPLPVGGSGAGTRVAGLSAEAGPTSEASTHPHRRRHRKAGHRRTAKHAHNGRHRHAHRKRHKKLPFHGRLDLNTADAAALAQLPGLGPGLAERIVALRRQVGPYGAIDDLLDVAGMTQRRIASIAPYVTVNGNPELP